MTGCLRSLRSRRARLARLVAPRDDGRAVIEFIFLGILMLLPLLYDGPPPGSLVLGLARWS